MATKKTQAKAKTTQTFTAEEREAMRERAREQKAEARRGAKGKAGGEGELLAKIAEMKEPERTLAKKLHALVTAAAPSLEPKTWYGMPAWARDGKVVCFFQSASKFKTRYATFGFSDQARLDDGAMWATSFALTELTPAVEAKLRALVVRAVG